MAVSDQEFSKVRQALIMLVEHLHERGVFPDGETNQKLGQARALLDVKAQDRPDLSAIAPVKNWAEKEKAENEKQKS